MDPVNESKVNSPPDLRNRKQSEDYVLEDIYESVDFEFNLNGVHSDVGNMFQKFAKKELIKATLKKQVRKAESKLQEKNAKLKEAIKVKKQKLEEKITAPPFLRTSDKCAFTLGIVALCITEYILLKQPQWMSLWYTFLLFPLMIARYISYSQAKYQYFMLDFCYFVQVVLLVQLYIKPSPELFQILFTLSNGPLCVAIVMWRNSLVFHDLDKTTSVFIHMFPPLVTFSLRWYPPGNDFSLVCLEPDCRASLYYTFGVSFVAYCLWQALYLIQTEVIDKEKLAKDKQIMTSVRWMTEYKPHPVYKWMVKNGYRYGPTSALVLTQGIYTFITLLPIIPVFQYYELHAVYLCLIFLVCIWNGANYYFEIFTETYTDRLQRFLKEKKREKKEAKETKPAEKNIKPKESLSSSGDAIRN